MADGSNVFGVLLSGGLGATIGGILTAAISVFGRRGESRATAAELVTRAAGEMVDRLRSENKSLREAVLLLTDVLDEVLPQLDAPPDVIAKLKKAKRAAQRVV